MPWVTRSSEPGFVALQTRAHTGSAHVEQPPAARVGRIGHGRRRGANVRKRRIDLEARPGASVRDGIVMPGGEL